MTGKDLLRAERRILIEENNAKLKRNNEKEKGKGRREERESEKGREQRTGSKEQGTRNRELGSEGGLMMLSKKERAEKIASIQNAPVSLENAIRQLNDAQLDTPYREGGWTVRQVVHHLADSHMNAYVRMKLVLTEKHPTLKPYDQNSWATLSDATMPITHSTAILKGLHARWTHLLERVPESAWSRTAFHPENGEMTLEDLLTTYAAHGENHVSQITGLRKARGW